MNKKWMPITAGVLDILYGVGEVLGGSFDITASRFIVSGIDWRKIVFALLIAVGVLVIVSGVYALKRRMWWLALVGSIFAFIPPALYIWVWVCWPLFKPSYLLHAHLLEILGVLLLGFIGILAIFPIVLMVLSRKQFAGKQV